MLLLGQMCVARDFIKLENNNDKILFLKINFD